MEDYIFKNECILIIGGGIETIPGVLKAKELGLFVVISDIDKNAPSIKYADAFIQASTYSLDDTLKAAIEFNNSVKKINGVICIATDVPLTVAHVAEYFKLKAVSLYTADLASDKLKMKLKFQEDVIPIPWFQAISTVEELITFTKNKSFDLVLKPVDSRGARGVIKLNESLDLNEVFLESIQYSKKKQLILEQYLSGPQVSTEAIIIDGKAHNIGFSDRNYEFLEKYSPNIIENGGELPSFLDKSIKRKVEILIEKASKSLGVKDGIVKGDIVIYNGEPYVIEIATRLSGGYFCSHEIPLNTGVDFLKIALMQAMNKFIPSSLLEIKKDLPVVQRYIFPNPGVVKKIELDQNLINHFNVHLFELRVNVGDIINEMKGHPSRAGLVITSGANKKEALELAESIISSVKIITE
jgi:biotin carboxylase